MTSARIQVFTDNLTQHLEGFAYLNSLTVLPKLAVGARDEHLASAETFLSSDDVPPTCL